VPIRLQTGCWKTWSPKSTYIWYTRHDQGTRNPRFILQMNYIQCILVVLNINFDTLSLTCEFILITTQDYLANHLHTVVIKRETFTKALFTIAFKDHFIQLILWIEIMMKILWFMIWSITRNGKNNKTIATPYEVF
jgi:hypothetical protein